MNGEGLAMRYVIQVDKIVIYVKQREIVPVAILMHAIRKEC